MKDFRYYSFLFLHIVLLAAWYASPFYLDWRIVIATVVLYHLQIYLAKGCLLTRGQFGKENEGFYYHYLRRLGFNPNKRWLAFVLDYIIPGAMIILAIALQVKL
ncbi:MAG: hypothetical protein A2W41_05045 [Candidatus Ryanbacteria bacterium RIFCSPHIGHO2_01_45_13]|uniref:DUF2784 domain-containing protein n=1 Tax=Candidatus Ryanbacteria bacterium RIFCSPHIGHO2_01_45_13 TaxID=1802112 RepID=A0A1G2FU93_9BACT|nr:MAG: hypothetical protein A2W41_05045 [Candidatus Ryanbacteria bacterium RIFCSPHIGHO2_01_45_13]